MGGAVGQREAGQDSCKVQSGNKERMLFNATSDCRKIYRAGTLLTHPQRKAISHFDFISCYVHTIVTAMG